MPFSCGPEPPCSWPNRGMRRARRPRGHGVREDRRGGQARRAVPPAVVSDRRSRGRRPRWTERRQRLVRRRSAAGPAALGSRRRLRSATLRSGEKKRMTPRSISTRKASPVRVGTGSERSRGKRNSSARVSTTTAPRGAWSAPGPTGADTITWASRSAAHHRVTAPAPDPVADVVGIGAGPLDREERRPRPGLGGPDEERPLAAAATAAFRCEKHRDDKKGLIGWRPFGQIQSTYLLGPYGFILGQLCRPRSE